MIPLTSRLYQELSDITLIIEFLRSIRPVALLTEHPSIYEIPELLAIPQNQATTRLWLLEEEFLVGFAFVDAFHTLRFDLDWQTQSKQIESEILAWGNECLKNKYPMLYSTSHESDTEHLAFFVRHQFVQCAESILHMACSLNRSIRTPHVPFGFTIRSVRGEEEAAEIASLHRAAFQTPYMTAERRMSIMRRSDYDPSLDLVAVASDGTLAAYALGQVNKPEGIQGVSYADLFATHPKFQDRGLASTLMLIVLKRLQEKGYRIAKLSTNSHNHSMQHVASMAGFETTSKTLRFQRQVDLA